MPEYPHLVHLSVPELIGAAGGDPWRTDETVQAGSPGEISELATSFRKAGVCMTETDEEFDAAKKRFKAAWDRDDPVHPVNDAEEVRRATQWLKLGKEQMAKVSANLQNIAVTLAKHNAAAISRSVTSTLASSRSTTSSPPRSPRPRPTACSSTGRR
jgi:hypothetical protein